MTIYLEKEKFEPFPEDSLRKAIEHVENSGRFHRDSRRSNHCYFLGEVTDFYALQTHTNRVQVNEQLLSASDPLTSF